MKVKTTKITMKQDGNISSAYEALMDCTLCPRNCHVDRTDGGVGFCGTGKALVVSSVGPHFGEEPPISGHYGSGTVFLAGCGLLCDFCQNHNISHGRAGNVMTEAELVRAIMRLQQIGCHNINFVTPTHFTPHIIEVVSLARTRGLRIPVVYNCGGYESIETLKMLEGFVDIYMPDIKFLNSELAERYCRARNYPSIVRAAVKEMHRQVGDLEIGETGLASRGLLIRHLVMPGAAADSRAVIDFIADEISPASYVNVMEQYRPSYKAYKYPELNRPLTDKEFKDVFDYAANRGLRLA